MMGTKITYFQASAVAELLDTRLIENVVKQVGRAIRNTGNDAREQQN